MQKLCQYRGVKNYPALTGSKTPPQNPAKVKKLGGGSTVRKSLIGEG
ncbi:Acetyltransferase, GNAT [Bacillus cereus Rock4-18]|nr:Acetyltransferase, GNAT [Bacillus cereus Rock4-18]